jgi:hypothetical protein
MRLTILMKFTWTNELAQTLSILKVATDTSYRISSTFALSTSTVSDHGSEFGVQRGVVAYLCWITGRSIIARNSCVGAGGRGVEVWIRFFVALVGEMARFALHPHQVTARVHNENEFLGWAAQVECHVILQLSILWKARADRGGEFHSLSQPASNASLVASRCSSVTVGNRAGSCLRQPERRLWVVSVDQFPSDHLRLEKNTQKVK